MLPMLSNNVYASDKSTPSGVESTFNEVFKVKPGLDSPDGIIKLVVNWLLYFVIILSVIMIVFGGLKYVTSSGDSGKVGEAKKTIVYAIVGLVVAILAYAIVNFVFNQFKAA